MQIEHNVLAYARLCSSCSYILKPCTQTHALFFNDFECVNDIELVSNMPHHEYQLFTFLDRKMMNNVFFWLSLVPAELFDLCHAFRFHKVSDGDWGKRVQFWCGVGTAIESGLRMEKTLQMHLEGVSQSV